MDAFLFRLSFRVVKIVYSAWVSRQIRIIFYKGSDSRTGGVFFSEDQTSTQRSSNKVAAVCQGKKLFSICIGGYENWTNNDACWLQLGYIQKIITFLHRS